MAKSYRYILKHPVEHLENREIYGYYLFVRVKYQESVNTEKQWFKTKISQRKVLTNL